VARIERAWVHMVGAADHFEKGRDSDPTRADGIKALRTVLDGQLSGAGRGLKVGSTAMLNFSDRVSRLEGTSFGPPPDPGVKGVYAHLSASSHPNFHALYETNRNGATHFTLSDETILDSFRVAAVSFAAAWSAVADYHGWDTVAAEEAKAFCTGLNPGSRSAR